MSDTNNQTEKDKGSNPAGFIILGLLVVVLGIGAWYLLKNPSEAPEAIVSETTLPPEGVSPSDQQIAADATSSDQTIAPAESTPGMESAPAGTTDSAAAEPIDVQKAMGIRAIGNPDAPIKIIEYASLTCSHCAHFHNDVFPALKTKYIDTGKVYFEYREFPLNDPALKATITARCLPEDKYADFVAVLFKSQAQWSEGIDYMVHLKQNAKLAGLSDAQFEACQANPAIKMKIAENMQTAQDKWKVAATPTFIINEGKKTISGAQPLENFEAAFREVTNNAIGEAPKVE